MPAVVGVVDVAGPGAVGGSGELQDLFGHPLGRVEPALAELVELRAAWAMASVLLVGGVGKGKVSKQVVGV
jgi:hypothetical protein